MGGFSLWNSFAEESAWNASSDRLEFLPGLVSEKRWSPGWRANPPEHWQDRKKACGTNIVTPIFARLLRQHPKRGERLNRAQ